MCRQVWRPWNWLVLLFALPAVLLILCLGLWSGREASAASTYSPSANLAANHAAISGTWVMVDYSGPSPKADILREVNVQAELYGVPDTNNDPYDMINDNVLAYYVDFDGNRLQYNGSDWELHAGPDIIPGGAYGLEVEVAMRPSMFPAPFAVQKLITASAAARYEPDGGLLPMAVNEYWIGSQGHCPYDNCGEPYSFVRDPAELPPFSSTDGGATWQRNCCPDPYNDNTCQGPYDGCGENYGQAFALLGADAKPNYGSQDPRGFVHLDYRYDALEDGGLWYWLVANDTWLADVNPPGYPDEMPQVIADGAYQKVPLPRALHEPPPIYIDGWGYCWGTPSEENCFNYPASGRSAPYDVVEFLSGVDAAQAAQLMYDGGDYVGGCYAPGQRFIAAVYNGCAVEQWGQAGSKEDAAVLVGYAGIMIVGYGTDMDYPCNCPPFDLNCFQGCISGGAVNTVYGLVAPDGDLVIDPTHLLWEFLPKKVVLIRPAGPPWLQPPTPTLLPTITPTPSTLDRRASDP
ncbi:MAG: hypothetical protein JXA37_10325 [Chloroflexia bacterium]|nr:hypothetical protein [Chloroflexia bacterium]